MLSLCVCLVCVFVRLQLYRGAKEKNLFMVVIWAVWESHRPRGDEFCIGLFPVTSLPVHCTPYIHPKTL